MGWLRVLEIASTFSEHLAKSWYILEVNSLPNVIVQSVYQGVKEGEKGSNIYYIIIYAFGGNSEYSIQQKRLTSSCFYISEMGIFTTVFY